MNNKNSFGRILGSVFFIVLFICATLIMELLYFIQPIAEKNSIPDIGDVSSEYLEMIFTGWYPIALGGVLVTLPVLFIVLLNLHCIRRIFFWIGIAACLTSLLDFSASVLLKPTIRLVSVEWQEMMLYSTEIGKSYLRVFSIILLLIGSTCLSVSASIRPIKGDEKNEENC